MCALNARPGKSVAINISNPGATLFILDALRFHEQDVPGSVVDSAIETLLAHWESRVPMAPFNGGSGQDGLESGSWRSSWFVTFW